MGCYRPDSDLSLRRRHRRVGVRRGRAWLGNAWHGVARHRKEPTDSGRFRPVKGMDMKITRWAVVAAVGPQPTPTVQPTTEPTAEPSTGPGASDGEDLDPVAVDGLPVTGSGVSTLVLTGLGVAALGGGAIGLSAYLSRRHRRKYSGNPA